MVNALVSSTVEHIHVPGQNDEIDMNNGDLWGYMGMYGDVCIANLRYPAKNDKFFAGERRYSN